MTTTNDGVDQNQTNTGIEPGDLDGFLDSGDDAADFFLSRWKDAEGPSEDDEGGEETTEEETTSEETETDDEGTDDEEVDEDQEDQDDDADESDDEPADTGKPKKADLDALVEITVDGETRTVPVKDLTRLFGQEASLTKKSQAVAAKAKEVEAQELKYVTGVQTLLEKSWKKFEPFTKIDFLVASKELSTEDFAALRKNAQEAHDEFNYLKSELDGTVETFEKRRAEGIKEAAQAAIPVLTETFKGLGSEWNETTYNEIRTYAVSQGLDAKEVNQYVNPTVLTMIYKAMKHDAVKKAATKKKAAAPKKVIKPSTGNSAAKIPAAKQKSKINQQLRSGELDDITAAIMAGWQQ